MTGLVHVGDLDLLPEQDLADFALDDAELEGVTSLRPPQTAVALVNERRGGAQADPLVGSSSERWGDPDPDHLLGYALVGREGDLDPLRWVEPEGQAKAVQDRDGGGLAEQALNPMGRITQLQASKGKFLRPEGQRGHGDS